MGKRTRNSMDEGLKCNVCWEICVVPIATCKAPHLVCYACVHDMINAAIQEHPNEMALKINCPTCRAPFLYLYDLRYPQPIEPRYGHNELERLYDHCSTPQQWACPFCQKDLGSPSEDAQRHILGCDQQLRKCPNGCGNAFLWKKVSYAEHLKGCNGKKCEACGRNHPIESKEEKMCESLFSSIQQTRILLSDSMLRGLDLPEITLRVGQAIVLLKHGLRSIETILTPQSSRDSLESLPRDPASEREESPNGDGHSQA